MNWHQLSETDQKWDTRYVGLAWHVSQWSKDPSSKMGAVIVRPDRTVASLGYNGFPKNMSDDEILYADREVKYSRIVHCEMNALLHARETVEGYTLYTTAMCCDRCAVHMLQAGITRFVWPEPSEDLKQRWGESFQKTWGFFDESEVETVEIPMEVYA